MCARFGLPHESSFVLTKCQAIEFIEMFIKAFTKSNLMDSNSFLGFWLFSAENRHVFIDEVNRVLLIINTKWKMTRNVHLMGYVKSYSMNGNEIL